MPQGRARIGGRRWWGIFPVAGLVGGMVLWFALTPGRSGAG
ncbi:MAG: hypothetical protein WHU94_15090 [Thermogemmata sp.]|nr:hypothetical protein [Thermogemmata fonticola]MCX8139067.1 hypothetical protein [Gemmataceae bacterium]